MENNRTHLPKIGAPINRFLGIILAVLYITVLFLLGVKFSSAPAVMVPVADIPPAFANLALSAKAVYVLDGKTGEEIFSINGDSQLPLASLTKIMMAVTALSLAPEDLIVTIQPDFLKSEGDSGLFGNEKWHLKDLLDLTLVESSNDGANAIASVAGAFVSSNTLLDASRDYERFVSVMNKKAEELNLTQTYFLNPTGLDENTDVSGGYGSARDIATLFSYAQTKYPNLFEATTHTNRQFASLSDFKHTVKNTNIFVDKIPALLGSKTGYTDLAGGNLVISFDAGPDRPIIIAVLGSTEQGRFEDVEKLVWSTLDYMNNK